MFIYARTLGVSEPMIKSAKQLPLVRSGIALLRSLARRSYHTATIRLYGLEFRSQESNAAQNATRSNWDVAINKRQDLEGYDPHAGWQSKSDFDQSCAERFARGEVLFSILVDHTLAHYGWLIFPARSIVIPEVDQIYQLPAGAAYLYDFYTHPAFRNRGMYQASLRQILAHLQSQGCSAAYIGVAPSNVPSCRAIEKLGFQAAATLGYRRIATNVRQWVQEHSALS
jgi:RimJ/RimL family protein N-acetyltransferase